MMAGAKVAMMASVLLREGPERAHQILVDLKVWMKEHDYVSIKQMQGSMNQKATNDPHALRRTNYIEELNSFKNLP